MPKWGVKVACIPVRSGINILGCSFKCSVISRWITRRHAVTEKGNGWQYQGRENRRTGGTHLLCGMPTDAFLATKHCDGMPKKLSLARFTCL